MKIFSWNVRGPRRKGFLAQNIVLISKYNLDIIALMETRVLIELKKSLLNLNLQNVLEIPRWIFGRNLVIMEKIKL